MLKLSYKTSLQFINYSKCFVHHAYRFQSTNLNPIIKPAKIINENPDLKFSITQRAAKRLADIYNDSKDILRITVESGGCHGFQYNLKLIKETDIKIMDEVEKSKTPKNSESSLCDDDLDVFDDDFESSADIIYVLPDDKGKVVIDQNSLKILDNTTLNYTTELIGTSFKINGGNMTTSCGCGSSFGIDL